MTVNAVNFGRVANDQDQTREANLKKEKQVIPNVQQAGAYLSHNTAPVNNIGNILAGNVSTNC